MFLSCIWIAYGNLGKMLDNAFTGFQNAPIFTNVGMYFIELKWFWAFFIWSIRNFPNYTHRIYKLIICSIARTTTIESDIYSHFKCWPLSIAYSEKSASRCPLWEWNSMFTAAKEVSTAYPPVYCFYVYLSFIYFLMLRMR